MYENDVARTGARGYGLLHTDGPRVPAGLALYSRLEFRDGDAAWMLEDHGKGRATRTGSRPRWRAAAMKVAHRVASLLL